MLQQVGGMAAIWSAISLRMRPTDFRVRTLYNRDVDWPIDYDELEPYYGRAEGFIGVSGTNDDNPFAPPRSVPYPMPEFPLGYYDNIIRERLADALDIHVHTTPQARAREAYDGRAGCANIGMCHTCPIFARYTPLHHLNRALATGSVTLESDVTVRRIIVEDGKARGVVVQPTDGSEEREHLADIVIVAAGAIESARLLLLSKTDAHPDGIGNTSGHVGQHLGFHVLRYNTLRFSTPIYSARAGAWIAQSEQFVEHDNRGQYGGYKLEFYNNFSFGTIGTGLPSSLVNANAPTMQQTITEQATRIYSTTIVTHAESDITPQKYVALAGDRIDRFGDPFAQVHYDLSDFDRATYDITDETSSQIARALDAEIVDHWDFKLWHTGYHHMGTTRMSEDIADGVVNKYGEVHDVENLFVMGSSNYPTTGAVNPTLTIVALTLMMSDYILEQRLSAL